MGKKNCIIISIISLILLAPIFSSVNAAENVTLVIHTLSEKARTRYNSPVIIAGVWHYINVTFEGDVQTINLKFYNGTSVPSTTKQSESNYYEWKYSSQGWADLKEYDGYSYINESNCQKTGDTFSFCVGIKDTFPKIIGYSENWTLDIYKNQVKVYSKNIVIEKPTIGLSKMHNDIIPFRVEPQTASDITNNDEYFIIGNTGNIPLRIDVDYGDYNKILDITNSGNILQPGSDFDHIVTLHAQSWNSGIKNITGEAIGTIPGDLIITTASITFETSIAMNAANLEISIGYSDYEIELISGTNIVFQYPKNIRMNESDTRDIKVYISGEGTVILDVLADEKNVGILSVSGKDQTSASTLTITNANDIEYVVTIKLEAIRESNEGLIYYYLTVNDKRHSYETNVVIGPPSQETTSAFNIPTSSVIIALIILLVVGYMIYTQIKHKRR